MANALHRMTKQYLRSVNTPEYPVADWIINPDLTAVAGQPNRYWLITGDTITLMDQAAQDVVDVQVVAAQTAADRTSQKARIDGERILKALALVIMGEINTLRAEHGLADRTATQLLNAIRAEVDNV